MSAEFVKIRTAEVITAVFQALKELGGSGTNRQIDEKVIAICEQNNPGKVIDRPRKNGYMTELEYRSAWMRTLLKKYGALENPVRGVWAIVPGTADVAPRDVTAQWSKRYRDSRKDKSADGVLIAPDESQMEAEAEAEADAEGQWRDELMSVLTGMEPDAFERLTKRLLLACNFTDVEVTGKPGDGGIDGTAIVKMNDLVGISVVFQCKRYKNTPVSAGDIRDLQGAMSPTDRGLFITTSRFTGDAQKQAAAKGSLPVDLIHGKMLLDKLKELGLGVKTELVEKVTIDENWYNKI